MSTIYSTNPTGSVKLIMDPSLTNSPLRNTGLPVLFKTYRHTASGNCNAKYLNHGNRSLPKYNLARESTVIPAEMAAAWFKKRVLLAACFLADFPAMFPRSMALWSTLADQMPWYPKGLQLKRPVVNNKQPTFPKSYKNCVFNSIPKSRRDKLYRVCQNCELENLYLNVEISVVVDLFPLFFPFLAGSKNPTSPLVSTVKTDR